MRQLFLGLLISIFSSLCFAQEKLPPQLYLLVDIDNVIVDNIAFFNEKDFAEYKEVLQQRGYIVQTINISTSRNKNRTLETYLKKTNQDPEPINTYNQRIDTESFVLRPSIKYFFESLANSGIKTHVLICSQKNNLRTKAFVEQLNLEINNIPFKNFATFLPKEKYAVDIKSLNGTTKRAKSSHELRERYSGENGPITANDYVISIDLFPESAFIASNKNHDLNIRISPFNVRKSYDANEDMKQINMILEQIINFVSQKNEQ